MCPINNFEEVEDANDEYWAEVPAQIRYSGQKNWHDVTLYFLLTFKGDEASGEFVYAYEFINHHPREVDVDTGDAIRPSYFAVGSNGSSGFIHSDDEADFLHVKADNQIAVGDLRMPAGKYRIGFSVTDLAGNVTEKFTDVTVDK